jgi:hypothetical protein
MIGNYPYAVTDTILLVSDTSYTLTSINLALSDTAYRLFDTLWVVSDTTFHVMNTMAEFTGDTSHVGIDFATFDYRVDIYPNPTKDFLEIHMDQTKITLLEFSIRDIHGRMIMRKKIYETPARINVETLHPGVYILGIHDGNKPIFRRFLKE